MIVGGRVRLGATGRALRRRNFRLFFFGQLISVTGTWMQTTAQAWLVLTLVGKQDVAFYLGLLGAVQFLPVLVLGLFGGMVADLMPKRQTVVATQIAAGLLALVLAGLVYFGVVQVWEIFALGLALGVVNAVDMPTRQSFVIEMVGRDSVVNAVALNSAAFNAARVVGPAIGGLVIGAFGLATCFFLNAASFLAVLGSLASMRDGELVGPVRSGVERSAGAVVRNLTEGLVYAWRTPVILLAVAVVGLSSMLAMNFNVLVPVMARDVLDVGATGLGFLMAALGLGSVVSALALAWVGRPSPRVIVGGAALLGLLEMALLAIRSFPVALVCMFGIGASAIGMTATGNTAIQLAVPNELRGRVMAVFTTVFAGSTPIGAIFAGTLASQLGAPAAFFAGGAGSLAIASVAFVLARPWLRGLAVARAAQPPREALEE